MIESAAPQAISPRPILAALALGTLFFLGVGCESAEVRQCKLDCTLAEATVCGADGKDYLNECHAGCAGTSAQYDGPCRMADAK